MIITTIEELRLCFPSHAIDNIDGFVGYIDNSEHDFLLQPLGQPLYDKLCDWYDRNRPVASSVDDKQTGYYNKLLLIAQRCVAFDAMSRAIDQQAVSINGAGINFASADDYKTADRAAIEAAKQSYVKEAHSALNRLLYTLEQWTAQCPSAEEAKKADAELFEICKFWRSSRYFYLAAQLLIPSATVLQEYLNIYDSREKFIQMLPDLHFIQEEQVAPSIGEDFCDTLVAAQLKGGTKRDATAATASVPQTLADDATIPPVLRRLLHKLRKIEATMLEGRTKVVKVDKDRRIAARDEGVRLLGQLMGEYCPQHQDDILLALGLPKDVLQAMKAGAVDPSDLQTDYPVAYTYIASPLFVAPVAPSEASSQQPCDCHASDFNGPDMALHVTMPLL